YESVSGYTTTGSTILRDIEALPKSLLFWRSSTHFLGGIGVVIFMLLILPSASTFRMRLSKMEISSLSQENYKFKTKQTIKVIACVYLGLTILAVVLLKIAGMNWFDAVNHAFSVVSTGGFSTKNLSILYYNSLPIEIVMSLFMLLASIHFGLIYVSVTTKSLKILKSPVIKFYLATLAIAAVIVAINIHITGHVDNIFTAFRQSIFQILAMASTSGFATADTTVWPNLSILILIYLTIQCGCSGSTTGGIKSDRVLIFFKTFKSQLKKHVHPNAVVPIRVGNHVIEKDIAAAAVMFILIYVLFIFLGAIIFSLSGMDFIDSFSSSVAHMGNIGPAFGSVGVFDNYDHIPLFAKFVSTIEMLLGRLEIYPLLMIFVIYKWR
ncbi:MAG: TrkH family potassium uptake protein, partial [Bacteroidales bacterium]|nr:TrkH family potassium uptake protein [Bacteroidales bacterium]